MNLLAIFLTGLTTGGLSCLALQGGLLAGTLPRNQEDGASQTFKPSLWIPVFLFLSSKLIVHTFFGMLLGLLGSHITISLTMRLVFQTLTSFILFATALNLLGISRWSRFFTLQPPRFIRKALKKITSQQSNLTPLFLGAFTILIPCGVTQAMELEAINSANPLSGALIMFTFILGTIPLFSLIGITATTLSQRWQKTFSRGASVLLIGLALYGILGVITVINPLALWRGINTNTQTPPLSQSEVQEFTLSVRNNGYWPRTIQVRPNIPVRLTLKSENTYSCALTFVQKDFGIEVMLEPTDTEVVTFIPRKKGKYLYSCSMGMYTGVIEVKE